MSELFIAVILGIVEGLTEFLPVSSTGHLIITGSLLKFGEGNFEKMYMVVIQLGAILAIVALYREKLFAAVRSLIRKEKRGGDWRDPALPECRAITNPDATA